MFVIRSSLRLWRDPDSLKPNSLTYAWCVHWLRVYKPAVFRERTQSGSAYKRSADWSRYWQSKDWVKQASSVKLTREDVQSYAMLQLLGGILLLVIVVFFLVSEWFLGQQV